MGWDRLVPQIVRAAFSGRFDLEIIGPRLQAKGQEPGLRRAAQMMAALFEKARLSGEGTQA